MSWDTVYSWSQFLVVLFAGVALVSGLIVNKRQAKQLLTLETSADDSKAAQQRVEIELADAKTKQAETELALEKVRAGLGQRMIIGDKADAFQNALTGKPKATVEIWFEPKDGEAFFFAQMIFVNLRSAGWEGTSVPTPIPELPSNNPSDASLPLAMRATGGMKSSLCLLAKELPQVSNESRDNFPFWVLVSAFEAAEKPCGGAENKQLPEGTLRIIVGAKP